MRMNGRVARAQRARHARQHLLDAGIDRVTALVLELPARALDRLSAETRAALRSRLERWLEVQIEGQLKPLKILAAAATDPANSSGVRAIAAMLTDAGGVLPRKTVLSAISHLEQADRQALHKLRVRLGPLDVYVDSLLKPSVQMWRGALLAVRTGQSMPKLPAPGAATLAADADARGAALAYRRIGRDWIRIDLADRLASHARKVRSAGGDDPVDAELATSVGLSEEAVARLMAEVGFTKAGEAWKWRGRHSPRNERRSASSASTLVRTFRSLTISRRFWRDLVTSIFFYSATFRNSSTEKVPSHSR